MASPPPPSTTRTAEPFFPACTSSSFTQCFFPCCPCLNEQRSSADGKLGRLLFPECGAEALTSLMMFAAVLTWSGTEIGGKIMIVWRSGGWGERGGMWGGVAVLFEWVAVLKTGKLSSRNPPHPTPPPPRPPVPPPPPTARNSDDRYFPSSQRWLVHCGNMRLYGWMCSCCTDITAHGPRQTNRFYRLRRGTNVYLHLWVRQLSAGDLTAPNPAPRLFILLIWSSSLWLDNYICCHNKTMTYLPLYK